MNFAHLHLIINHIPIVGIPVTLVFLVYGLFIGNRLIQRFSIAVLIGLAAMVVPVYLSGEPAEEVVEHLPGVEESLIETHEEAAKISLILSLLCGGIGLAALWFQRDEVRSHFLMKGLIGMSLLVVVSLLYTAYLGGKIRHSELRLSGDVKPLSPSAQSASENDNE